MIADRIKKLKSSATMQINRKSKEMQAKGIEVINLQWVNPTLIHPSL